MVTSKGRISAGPWIVMVSSPPPREAVTGKPNLAHKISVWFRDPSGNVTRDSPSHVSAANIIAVLICAEPTALCTSKGCKCAPRMVTGSDFSDACSASTVSSLASGAPARCSKSNTRRMGRRDKLASPIILACMPGQADNTPIKNRAVVPLLPAFNGASGFFQPVIPGESTSIVALPSPLPSSIETPRARRQSIVARVSPLRSGR